MNQTNDQKSMWKQENCQKIASLNISFQKNKSVFN